MLVELQQDGKRLSFSEHSLCGITYCAVFRVVQDGHEVVTT
jgi:hypothetical protein